MKVMIAGLGSAGRRHLRNLRALGVDDLLLYRTGHSTLLPGEFDDLPQTSELEAALQSRPDAVVVSNPTSLHMPVAIAAARAGASVLVEKPLSNDLSMVAELQSALAASGVRLLMGFQYRFHPGLQTVDRMIKEGRIGDPLFARALYAEYLPDWHPWEDYHGSYAGRRDLGGGVVLTLCHPFDYLRMLLGEVESLAAETWNSGYLGIEVEDGAEVLLDFESQTRASVHLNYNRRPPTQTLEISGTEGVLRWDYFAGTVELWTADSHGWTEYQNPQEFDRNSMFAEEMRHFLEVAQGDTEPLCTLDDGIKALEICLAVHESAARGRRQHFASRLPQRS